MIKLKSQKDLKKIALRKGISLITLAITVVVIVILSSVVILNVAGPNGIIHKAAMAKEVSDIATIKEEAEIVKAELMLDVINFNREDLIEKITKHFSGTSQGGRIVVENGDYAIYVKNDENLTIEVSKNEEGILFDGEFDLIVEVIDNYKIKLTPKFGGKQPYTEYAKAILKGKTSEEKAQIFIEGKKYEQEIIGKEFPYSTFNEYVKATYGEEDYPETLEEVLQIEKRASYESLGVDATLISMEYVKREEYDNSISFCVDLSEKNGWSYNIDCGKNHFGYKMFFGTENKEYVFTGEWNGQIVTKSVTLSNVNITTVSDGNIYNYDTTTGYITGVKEEYLEKGNLLCDEGEIYLSTGITKLVIPSQIDGVTIVGIAQGAFSDIDNIVSVELPDTIVEIGDSAFYDCLILSDVYISNSVETIGSRVFYGTKISQIFIPQSVTTIGSYAFYILENAVINCEVESKPDGWNNYWYDYYKNITVNWGQTRE